MRPEFFMDDKILMVALRCDDSTTVTRPATKAEQADHAAVQAPKKKPKADNKAAK